MISLIVPTVGRLAELDRLLSSLDRQSSPDFEVIVVDQNGDDRLVPVLAQHPGLTIRHLRSQPGVSRARNVGLQQVNSDLVAFPDDDCWYPPTLLQSVDAWFRSHPQNGGLFVTLRDEQDRPLGPRWPQTAGQWGKMELWHFGMTAVGFLRRSAIRRAGHFDQRLGPGSGTPYGSGEDVDFFLRSLSSSEPIWFEPGLTVLHPALDSAERRRDKTYAYSLAGGYTLRLHHYPFRMLLVSLVRSAGGAVVNLLRFRFAVAYSYLLRGAGVAHGYFLGPRDFRKMGRPTGA